MFSLGIDPSMTRTNGASSASAAASRNGLRNSSPPSVGERTLLCRLTFGIPGIAPSRTSLIPGWPAAVIEMESPSQLIPSEIQRMWTSSTPAGAVVSVAISSSCACAGRHRLVLELERVDEELVAALDLDVKAPARRARQREAVELRARRAGPAAPGRRHLLEHEVGAVGRRALGDEVEGERQRVRDDLTQVPDLDLDARDAPPARVCARDLHDAVGDRELVHRPALSRSSAAGRRRAGRGRAGRRTRSPAAPSPAG